ncbi:response regulator [Heliobacterium gestii]|uniref:Stage 0 sporulation protein A homolog n=1 Tax=Heliomicrobium gestii TaxID=2699 RepID=A0A845LIC7_HELGE|nr:chemotaxis protein CheW [Heliomicrobium gestii]MBM7866067.1 two-component system chemotaxis sensor kinase CheA [Heliomicrobium gestii]MZP42606.1 response regulator [Heliomicrobium gestii]
MQNLEFIKEFVEEAASHLETVENGLLLLGEGREERDTIHGIFRAVHSIKGTAGFFALCNIVELTHIMENLLGDARNGKLTIGGHTVDVLLAANDCLKCMVADVENSESADITLHVRALEALQKAGDHPPAEPSPPIVVTDASQNEVLLEEVEKTVITDALKHGHRLYKIRLNLVENVSASVSPVVFFRKISSIGQIIDSYTDISDVGGLDDFLEAGLNCVFLFTTVLEKKLIALALDIPEEHIEELDVNLKPEELAQILRESVPAAGTKAARPSDRPHTADLIANNGSGDSLATDQKMPVKAPVLAQTGNDTPPPQAMACVVDEAADAVKKAAVIADDTVRVHVSLLNDLLNLASEMVLGRNQLLRCLEGHRKQIAGLSGILQNIDNITTELQEKIMQTRMQPIAKIFNKFPRIIRELSKKLGKDMELHMEGTEVELDKSIIEALADPLTHLVRNAADHGIESPEKREALGKPKLGRILLKAYHEGGRVNIDIADDGGGIRAEKIRAKAVEKGLIKAREAEGLAEGETLKLLFLPGFSTAEQITDVSGRGVGMDVVKTNIERLGGSIDIFTQPERGTTFRLTLPLTLAIIPSLIVEVAGQKFALPQTNLQEMVRIKPGDANRKIERFHDAQVLRLRGRLLPVIHLGQVLGLRPGAIDTSAVVRVLVLKIGAKRYGLAVDRIHDGEEILVKPLPRHLGDCACYSGVTILGDGKTAMILDPDGIAAKANLRFTEEPPPRDDEELAAAEMAEVQNLLLFQCAGPETFSIDLAMIARIEPIQARQIERIGDKEFIQFRGDSLRVIQPQQYLPVQDGGQRPEKLYVLIPKLVRYPMGILIHRIHDIVQTRIRFNQENIRAKGIIGSTILQNRIVLVVNIFELFEMAAPEHYAVAEGRQGSGQQRTVLLAEDTPFFSRMEKNYLEWAGFRVLSASNGKEALRILDDESVDVVISDIQMPVMDGFELVRRIRADKRLAHLPVIALTSMTDEGSRRQGKEAGFDDYESKLDKERMLDTLEKVLTRKREAL